MLASSRVDLKIDQDRIDDTRNIEMFEDGEFPALRLYYDRHAHTHHNYAGLLHKALAKFRFFSRKWITNFASCLHQIKSCCSSSLIDTKCLFKKFKSKHSSPDNEGIFLDGKNGQVWKESGRFHFFCQFNALILTHCD